MCVGTDCFGVAVAVAVDFDFTFDLHPLLTLPIVRDRKWIKKALLFEPKASFKAFPFFVLHNCEAEGQWQRGRLSLLTFFGEAKKVIRWTIVQPIGPHPTCERPTTKQRGLHPP